MSDDERWQILRSEYVIETPHLRLRRDAVELPNGLRIDEYFVRESRGFVVVFALTADQRVVLVRQYKHGIGDSVLELPAGAIDAGESPVSCATRELAEETGFVGDPPELVAEFVVDATHSDSRCHLFLVRNAALGGPQQLDSTESIAVELVTLPMLRDFVRTGSIAGCPHVASIYAVFERLGLLTTPNETG